MEAETGRKLSYAQALAAVHMFRQALGDTPHRLALVLPGGILNAVIWLSALSGGHHLIPVSPDATEKEKLALTQRHRPDVLIVEHEEDAHSFASPQAAILTRQACEAFCEMLGEQPEDDHESGDHIQGDREPGDHPQGDHKSRPYNDMTAI